ncbi:putative MSP domain protein [Trichinella spiralis]|uniref:putative MSP domain protein n=1 Tax=Trichinella spiralis TaxID=6334 RepID=UPI0001EFE007|nr:putative MSP domain protein [Trichinella spiralis]
MSIYFIKQSKARTDDDDIPKRFPGYLPTATYTCKQLIPYSSSDLHRTWTELTKLFLQKAKRRKTKVAVGRNGHEDRRRITVAYGGVGKWRRKRFRFIIVVGPY